MSNSIEYFTQIKKIKINERENDIFLKYFNIILKIIKIILIKDKIKKDILKIKIDHLF